MQTGRSSLARSGSSAAECGSFRRPSGEPAELTRWVRWARCGEALECGHEKDLHLPVLQFASMRALGAFLLKTEIARIDPRDRVEPAAGDRANEWSRFDANDARVVLGVAADATEQEIHAAWRDLAKAYHPDRLAAFGLPDEMLRHADRVLARINAAFQRLKNDASAQSG